MSYYLLSEGAPPYMHTYSKTVLSSSNKLTFAYQQLILTIQLAQMAAISLQFIQRIKWWRPRYSPMPRPMQRSHRRVALPAADYMGGRNLLVSAVLHPASGALHGRTCIDIIPCQWHSKLWPMPGKGGSCTLHTSRFCDGPDLPVPP